MLRVSFTNPRSYSVVNTPLYKCDKVGSGQMGIGISPGGVYIFIDIFDWGDFRYLLQFFEPSIPMHRDSTK